MMTHFMFLAEMAWDSPTGKFAFRPIAAGKYLSAKGNDLDLVTNLGVWKSQTTFFSFLLFLVLRKVLCQVSETELFEIVRGATQANTTAPVGG
jgi:hypothetical protein